MSAPAIVVDESALSGTWVVVDIDRLPFVPMSRSRLRLAWGYRATVAGYLGHRPWESKAEVPAAPEAAEVSEKTGSIAGAACDRPPITEAPATASPAETPDPVDREEATLVREAAPETSAEAEPAAADDAPPEAAREAAPEPEPAPVTRIPPDRIVRVQPARRLPGRETHFPLDPTASGRAQAWAEAARRRQQELEVASAREAMEQALLPQR